VSSPIQFFSEDIPFILKDKMGIRKWLNLVIREEKRKPWYINFIFCNDEYLLDLNRTYLKHNTLTDILTFPYAEDPATVSGDIFISIDRVRENAGIFSQDFQREILRVMAHGVLHLMGYPDHPAKQKELMTEREDHCLDIYDQLHKTINIRNI
jgi:rRNA maturation RNase YbeY